MKKKLICCALLAGLGLAQSAAAQTYDDRWYVGAGAGIGFFDEDRDVADTEYGMIGVGKFITPHISIDAELWHSNPDINVHPFPPSFSGLDVGDRNWELMSLSIVGRYYFTSESRTWDPYIVAGIGAQEHHDGTIVYRTFPEPGFNGSRTGTDVMFMLGLGAQFDLGYPYLRAEIGARFDSDDEGQPGADLDIDEDNGDDNFIDGYLGFEFIFPIGPEAQPAPPPPPPPAKTCAELDDDGDGVNNCDDKCFSEAGSTVGPDGCPVPPPEPVMEPKPFRG